MDTINLQKTKILTEISEPYTTLLYDVDGTLANNMHAHKAAYKATALEYGIHLDPDIIDELAGWTTVAVAQEIALRYQKAIDPKVFAQRKSEIFLTEYIMTTTPIEFVVAHLLNHIGKKKIGLVSGGSRSTLRHTIDIIGLTGKYDVLVCAGDTTEGKPSPQPFLRAASLLHAKPEDCLVFEDGDPGVQGAKAAGMGWVRIDQI